MFYIQYFRGITVEKQNHNNQHIHDLVVKELLELHSIAAMIYLIDHGREIGIEYDNVKGFISKSRSSEYVSLWIGDIEQAFSSTEQLMDNAEIHGIPLKSVWKEIRISELW